MIALFVYVAGACAATDKENLTASGQDNQAPPDAPGLDPEGDDERGSAPDLWWEQGPGPDEGPSDGVAPSVANADLECIGTDPFYHLFTCPGACHYVIGTISGYEAVPDGHVSELGSTKYFVADTRIATVTIVTYLANPPLFDDAPFSAAPLDSFVVQEQPSGYADIYLKESDGATPAYQSTQWEKQWMVPPHAKLPPKGTVVMGFKDARDIIHPDHRLVTVVFPLTEDGLVDMIVLKGTGVMADAGWPADTPTEPVSIDEAQEWFGMMVTYNGVRCFPSEVEGETETEYPDE